MKFSKFFSNLQEASWYRQFLDPVINEIHGSSYLLDIGTGPGKLLEILSHEKNVSCEVRIPAQTCCKKQKKS